MKFRETELQGVFIIDIETHCDERGFFARTWCQKEFSEHKLGTSLKQASISWNRKKGTLRGIHYQVPPYEEAKLIRCTQGAIFDVIVDLRKESPTYLGWKGVELTAENHKMLYVPEGLGHGFQTLEDNTEVFYQISEFFVPEAGRGIRYNDPCLSIRWPLEVTVVSEKDANWHDYID